MGSAGAEVQEPHGMEQHGLPLPGMPRLKQPLFIYTKVSDPSGKKDSENPLEQALCWARLRRHLRDSACDKG